MVKRRWGNRLPAFECNVNGEGWEPMSGRRIITSLGRKVYDIVSEGGSIRLVHNDGKTVEYRREGAGE